jgi:hypothetical protein
LKRDVAHIGLISALASAQQEPAMQYVGVRDLRVGATIDVYGRQLFLCGVDEFTRQYYLETYPSMRRAEFASISMTDPAEVVHGVVVPPPTGFGTDEDSLGSFLGLVPKVPKRDARTLHVYDGVLLRFSAKFSRPAEVDASRTFILTYYLSDASLQLFEAFERNAGHIGGKFLDRERIINIRTGGYFAPGDFFVGGRVEVHSTEFIILEADEYTRKFCEQNKQIWSQQRGNHEQQGLVEAFHGIAPFSLKKNAVRRLQDKRPF